MNHRLVFGTRRIGKGFSYRSNLTALGTLLLLGAIVIIVIASTPGQPAMAHHAQPTVHFSDVATTESYYAGVEHLANHGVISGYSNGTFLPNNYASRGQMSKIIVNAEGWSINLAGAPHFTDVDSANPFYTFIETAYNRGMISGYSDGTFHPFDNTTRGQFTKMLTQARISSGATGWFLNIYGGPHFNDVSTSDPFYLYIETAYQHGLISNKVNSAYFYPGNPITRGTLSKMTYEGVYAAVRQMNHSSPVPPTPGVNAYPGSNNYNYARYPNGTATYSGYMSLINTDYDPNYVEYKIMDQAIMFDLDAKNWISPQAPSKYVWMVFHVNKFNDSNNCPPGHYVNQESNIPGYDPISVVRKAACASFAQTEMRIPLKTPAQINVNSPEYYAWAVWHKDSYESGYYGEFNADNYFGTENSPEQRDNFGKLCFSQTFGRTEGCP